MNPVNNFIRELRVKQLFPLLDYHVRNELYERLYLPVQHQLRANVRLLIERKLEES